MSKLLTLGILACTFNFKGLESEDEHSLHSKDGVVAVGEVRVVCGIVWRNHTAAGGSEVCTTA